MIGYLGFDVLDLVSFSYCQLAKLDTRLGLGLVHFLNYILGLVTEADEGKRIIVATGDISSGVGMLHYDLF
jgi:hypothetical protein